jgi:hypothetical protein
MRTRGRALVETTLPLDIRPLVRAGAIRDDVHLDGKMELAPDDALTIAFEVSTRDRANCWMRVRSTLTDRWSGERRDIDDKISLATIRHPSGGWQWCFVCPVLGWRVRKLYLPAGARHFRSRQAYRLAYETEHLDDRERAWRRVRKCRRQLGSEPDAIGRPYPEKPAGMLPSRYAWLLDRLDAAEDDLGLPLTLGGPRFAYRPDRHRLGSHA